MKFIIFHGSFGNSKENWIPWLKEELEKFGNIVSVPEFPIEDWDQLTKNKTKIILKKQNLINWLNFFKKSELKNINKTEKLCFIAHSIASVFIFHLVLKFNIKLEKVIFISPFLEKLNTLWQIDKVNETFYKTNFNFGKIKKLIPVSIVIYSDNDPYVGRKLMEKFAEKLNSKKKLIINGGHFNKKAGFEKFPQLLKLCLK